METCGNKKKNSKKCDWLGFPFTKTRVFRFTKGSAGRMKFARPQTSGTRYFKQLFFFFGNTETHICIHLWTKVCCTECASCRFKKHVSKRQRSCWLILSSWPTEGNSGPFSNCVPDAAATFAIVNMSTTYLRHGGSISLKTEMFISPLHVIFATLQFSFCSTRGFQMSADPMTFDLKTYGGLRLWVIKPKNTYVLTLT